MNENHFFRNLEWDSNFFGFKVGVLKDDSIAAGKAIDVLEELYAHGVGLVYYSSSEPMPENIFKNDLYEIRFIMERVPIIKKLVKRTEIDSNIFLYKQDFPTEDLIELALLAGKQGRFGRDPRIKKELFSALFEHWIKNSIQGKLADDILVYRKNEEILGFATIKIEGTIGYAPLFAVKRRYEGTGISFSIMRAVEEILMQRNCTHLKSATQRENIKALAVFKRFGFEPQNSFFVYHLWKKDKNYD